MLGGLSQRSGELEGQAKTLGPNSMRGQILVRCLLVTAVHESPWRGEEVSYSLLKVRNWDGQNVQPQ